MSYEGLNDKQKEAVLAPIDKPVLVLAGAGSGKCVAGNSLILTDKGLIRIDAVPNYYKVNNNLCEANVHSYDLNGDRFIKKTSHWYNMGRCETLKIITENGYEIEGTPEHPLFIKDEKGNLKYKKLAEFVKGDSVALSLGDNIWNTMSTIEEGEALKNGATFGAMVSKTLHDDIRLPMYILEANLFSVYSFLWGLFGFNGTFKGDYVTVKLASEQLSKDLQVLLLNCGIKSKRVKKDCDKYLLSILRFDFLKFSAVVHLKKEVPYSGEKIFYEKITSIEESIAQVYDFTVPDTHSFVANGFINHNTRVLTYRVAHLIENNIDPGKIMALTFTNKAAMEMKTRLRSIVGNSADRLWAGTFHSICLRILRIYGELLGYRKNFSIYDDSDALGLIKEIIQDKNYEIHESTFINYIAQYKNNLISPQEAFINSTNDFEKTIAIVYEMYQDRLLQSNAMDFDDMINNVVYLIEKDQKVRSIIQTMFQYVLVDEHQDVNKSQHILLTKIAEKHRRLFVVGDDWQCLGLGSRVKLENGLEKKVEDLIIGDMVQTVLGGKIGFAPVTNMKINRQSPIVRVVTKSGHVMNVTPNHKCFAYHSSFNEFNYKESDILTRDPVFNVNLYLGDEGGPCLVTLINKTHLVCKRFCSESAYKEAEEFASKLKKKYGADKIVERFILSGEKHLNIITAENLTPTMQLPVEIDGKVHLSEIVSVEAYEGEGSVDIEIAKTGIVIADGVISHNSIYKFRGADINNILSFEKDFPDATVVKLEENYRSTKNIVHASNNIIAHNKNQKEKELWTKNTFGDLVSVFGAFSDQDEAEWIASKIDDYIKNGVDPLEIAILYRANFQSRSIEKALLDRGIPYQITGGVSFFQRREIKDLMAYLKVLANNDDFVSMSRIINIPRRGIGKETIKKLKEYVEENRVSFLEAIKASKEIEGIGTSRQYHLEDFIRFLESIDLGQSPKDILVHIIKKVGYMDYIRKESPEDYYNREENIEELLTLAEKFTNENPMGTLFEFVQEMSLYSELDQQDLSIPSVKLMTVHSSKGLEFDYVFCIGLEEGIFPHHRSLLNDDDIEEERRLFYVATSRARKKLILTYADTRFFFGSIQENATSRFLEEIPEELIIEEGSDF